MSQPIPREFDPPLAACPLCWFQPVRGYYRDFRGISISRCPGCGMKFMNPQYTDAYLAAFYARYVKPEYPHGPEMLAMTTRRREENYARIERHLRPGRLLSIGCGSGRELTVAQKRGWQVEGYDVDPATTERIARTLGVPVYSGELVRLGLRAESYDCVFMDQVLEHAKRPGELLREAHRLLRPGGILFLGCPNIMSLASAAKTLLERAGLKRRNRGRHFGTQHHLFYFSPGVLRRLLERAYGFRVLGVYGDPLMWKRKYPNRIYTFLCRRLPWLDSTFQLLACKPA